MADNVAITAGSGTSIATDDVGGVHYQKMKIYNAEDGASTALGVYAEDEAFTGGDTGILPLAMRAATPADTSGTDGDYEPLQVASGYLWIRPPSIDKVSSNFTRPADTTAYAVNDAIANSTSAGSVTQLAWNVNLSAGIIRRIRVKKSDQTVATPTIRVWLWDTTVTAAAGDNAAFSAPLTDAIGFVDVAVTNAGTDDAVGWANCDIPYEATSINGLLQTLSVFTPANAETFTVDIWAIPS